MSSDSDNAGRPKSDAVEAKSADLSSAQFTSEWFYFYHLGGHHEPTRAYRIERPDRVPYDQVPAVIDEIFSGLPEDPDGHDLGDLTWRHKGYLVFVLEDAQDDILRVTFDRRPSSGNNSFLHGKTLPSVAGRDDLSAFYCVNYMRSRHDRDLREDEAELYRVNVVHGRRGADVDLPILGHEDAGTNLGPPKNEP
jgi:hypothetical protein